MLFKYFPKRKYILSIRQYVQTSQNLYSTNQYDVIVVGGGHAGCEAAAASARVGAKTLLLTHKISTIGEMSCNPSFGGIGKGHLMKEIDALDGLCGRLCDISGIQYRTLNKTKGPAVWGPRAQIDRDLYRSNMQQEIFSTPNLEVLESSVDDIMTADADFNLTTTPDTKCRCSGVILADGTKISSSAVVLTAGTFLRAKINIGLKVIEAGRMGDSPSVGLAKTIESLGFDMGRLKTGTPPRIDATTINYKGAVPFYGDSPPQPFSFDNDKVWIDENEQIICYTTHTKPSLKQVILDTLQQNKHVIEEVNGPRYCPSIESKILTFSDRNHICWLEPEGLDSNVVYLQGFSCTMPEEHQEHAVHQIDGLEKAKILKPGYGVEYDYMDPRQISTSLETYLVQRLFFAGQINGTTGYEEAAAQGLIAGVNAGRRSLGQSEFTVSRSEGYIGVLIDDLTTLGTNEPYRMFTSRTEFRMSLRPDNADERLTTRGFEEGNFVTEKRMNNYKRRMSNLENIIDILKTSKKFANDWRRNVGIDLIGQHKTQHRLSAFDFLGHVHDRNKAQDLLSDILKLDLSPENHWLKERALTLAAYSSLLPKEKKDIKLLQKEENLLIPDAIDYTNMNLKLEIREKLAKARPKNIAAATRIQGITPAALVYLLYQVKKFKPVVS